VSYAEFSIYPKLVVPGNAAQTVANIAAHHGLFLIALFSYLYNFIDDVIIAWAMYVLLAPVNRSLALLASWLQLVYAVIAIFATFNLATAYRMVTVPEYATLFGANGFVAQVSLLLHSFCYDYSLALVIFGLHLLLAGYLMVRSSYLP
jgi:hypothetical protein